MKHFKEFSSRQRAVDMLQSLIQRNHLAWLKAKDDGTFAVFWVEK